MVVDPGTVTLTNNLKTASFSVAGAEGSATWSVQNGNGAILTQSPRSATYQRTAAGDNVVIATDDTGNAAFATVHQP